LLHFAAQMRVQLADGSLTSKKAATRFGVSKATLYRYLA
jgi:predicted DNA-binding transcriptional regulator YafY